MKAKIRVIKADAQKPITMHDLNADSLDGNPIMLLSPHKAAYITDADGILISGDTICGKFIMTSSDVEKVNDSPQLKKINDIENMRDYGYIDDGNMVPISRETADMIFHSVPIYLLHDDGKEEFIQISGCGMEKERECEDRIARHAFDDGLFGVLKEDVFVLWDMFEWEVKAADYNDEKFAWIDPDKSITIGEVSKWFIQEFGCAIVDEDIVFPF